MPSFALFLLCQVRCYAKPAARGNGKRPRIKRFFAENAEFTLHNTAPLSSLFWQGGTCFQCTSKTRHTLEAMVYYL
jgi:hypothetical protein